MRVPLVLGAERPMARVADDVLLSRMQVPRQLYLGTET